MLWPEYLRDENTPKGIWNAGLYSNHVKLKFFVLESNNLDLQVLKHWNKKIWIKLTLLKYNCTSWTNLFKLFKVPVIITAIKVVGHQRGSSLVHMKLTLRYRNLSWLQQHNKTFFLTLWISNSLNTKFERETVDSSSSFLNRDFLSSARLSKVFFGSFSLSSFAFSDILIVNFSSSASFNKNDWPRLLIVVC